MAMLLVLLGLASGLEVTLLQTGLLPGNFSTITQPGQPKNDTARFADIGKAMSGMVTKLSNYDFTKPDPVYPVGGKATGLWPPVTVEGFADQATYRNTADTVVSPTAAQKAKYGTNAAAKVPIDKYLTATPFWAMNVARDTNMVKKSEYAADGQWGAKTKKFLTSGVLGYNWKFHEMTEKAYSKVVAKVAEGGVEKTKNTTVSKLENKNEQVKQSIDSTDTTKEDSKVYKGKALLQTKAVQDVTTTTSDEGYDRTKFKQGSSTEGKIGSQHGKTSGTYTNTAGGTFTSVMEMPKVTAKKSGSVDVDWRGGDTYTTSKMMAGMKKFIKRASRGESW